MKSQPIISYAYWICKLTVYESIAKFPTERNEVWVNFIQEPPWPAKSSVIYIKNLSVQFDAGEYKSMPSPAGKQRSKLDT